MKIIKHKPRRIGTAKRHKDRKALRGQLNDLDIENRQLKKLLDECLAVFDAEPDDATKLIPAVRAKIEALKGETKC